MKDFFTGTLNLINTAMAAVGAIVVFVAAITYVRCMLGRANYESAGWAAFGLASLIVTVIWVLWGFFVLARELLI